MWGMSDTIKKVENKKLFYAIESSKGQSGSGVGGDKWLEDGGIYTVGIHTGQEKDGTEENRGVRITKGKFNVILEWLKTYQHERSEVFSEMISSSIDRKSVV